MNIASNINAYIFDKLNNFDFCNNVYEALLYRKNELFSLLGIEVTESNEEALEAILFDYSHNYANSENVYIVEDSKGYWRLIDFDKEYFVSTIAKYLR